MLKTVTDPKDQVTTHTYATDDSLLTTVYTNATIPTPGVTYTYDPVYPRVATAATAPAIVRSATSCVSSAVASSSTAGARPIVSGATRGSAGAGCCRALTPASANRIRAPVASRSITAAF